MQRDLILDFVQWFPNYWVIAGIFVYRSYTNCC